MKIACNTETLQAMIQKNGPAPDRLEFVIDETMDYLEFKNVETGKTVQY